MENVKILFDFSPVFYSLTFWHFIDMVHKSSCRVDYVRTYEILIVDKHPGPRWTIHRVVHIHSQR